MDEHWKEVYFDEYCKTCRYKDISEDDDPCFECLDTPARVNSHKPLNYSENRALTKKLRE